MIIIAKYIRSYIGNYKYYFIQQAKHITQELIDRNYLQAEEDIIGCREFIRGYFVGLSDRNF